MPREVTVLSLEGDVVRALRLSESGKAYAVSASETWLVAPEAPADATEADADESAETPEVSDSDPLADAFAAAVKRFGTHEFVLSLPLSKLLTDVVRVPAEKRDELEDVARAALEKISPFPDEDYRVGVEVVSENDRETVVVAAALPEAVSLAIGDALDAAKARVTRTDITAFGRVRTLWPQILAGGKARRRIVLMDLDDGWDFLVLDDDAPSVVRGLGAVSDAAALGREVMLGLIRAEDAAGAREVDEIVLVTAGAEAPEEIRAHLATFGTVRTVVVTDEMADAGVEGIANRAVEGAACDVTPEAWRTSLSEARLKTRVLRGLAAAGGLWLLAMGVLFGVPLYFNWLTGREKAQSRQHQRAYKAVKDMKDRVKLVQRYSDHARGALETLKAFSDRMPEGVTLTQFQYRRGESVRISAEAQQPTDAYAFKTALDKTTDEDGEKVYADVTLSEVRQSRGGGNRFDIEAKFPAEADDAPAAKSGKGGR